MDEAHATTRLIALQSRRLTALETALSTIARHVRTPDLAAELRALAEAHGDDEAASLLWTLARVARG